MSKIQLQDGEKDLGTWTILYLPPNGGKYNGKLTITNKNLYYDAQFDVSAKGLVEEALFVKWGSEAFVCIPKNRIKSVDTAKSLFAKKVLVTLDNGDVHTFNYGMLNIDKVTEAIKAQ